MPPLNEKAWQRVRQVLERIPYGEVTIVMQKSVPVRIEIAVKNIKLDIPDEEFRESLRTIAL